jgi:hypothetical protein
MPTAEPISALFALMEIKGLADQAAARSGPTSAWIWPFWLMPLTVRA